MKTCGCHSRSWIQMGICMDCHLPLGGAPITDGWWDGDRAMDGDQPETFYHNARANAIAPPPNSRIRYAVSGQIGD